MFFDKIFADSKSVRFGKDVLSKSLTFEELNMEVDGLIKNVNSFLEKLDIKEELQVIKKSIEASDGLTILITCSFKDTDVTNWKKIKDHLKG